MLRCGGEWLKKRQLVVEHSSLQKKELWWRSEPGEKGRVPEPHHRADRGQAKGRQAGPFQRGVAGSQAEQEKAIWQGQGHSFAMVQETPGKTIK